MVVRAETLEGGTVVNQASVTGIVHDDAGRAAGVKFVDNLTGEEHTIKARSVVNAAGCFVDDTLSMLFLIFLIK